MEQAMLRQATNLLDRYGYIYQNEYVGKILNRWEVKKSNLLTHFRKHPNWDEDTKRIVLDAKYNRNFSKSEVLAYESYVWNWADKQLAQSEVNYKINGKYIGDWADALSVSKARFKEVLDLYNKGYDVMDALMEAASELCEAQSIVDQYKWSNMGWVPKDMYDKMVILQRIANIIGRIEEGEDLVTERLVDLFATIDIEIRKGAKTSRAIRKMLMPYGIFDDKSLNAHGRLICEEKYARFADGINPSMIPQKTYISLNPIDYWTMSFGHYWASCHTIDKQNERGSMNGEHTYNGCYSSGTQSYMGDETTVIVYTGEVEDKLKRCNFHINKDGSVIIQGRVYPDARDEGTFDYVPQFRQLVQQVVSETFNVPNNWEVKKGTEACDEYVDFVPFTHYPDYSHYDDCNVSLNKGTEYHPSMQIGSLPICPMCGKEHSNQENICCERCIEDEEPYAECDRCGCSIDEDSPDEVYIERRNICFCCAECAEEAGYRYCQDVEEWRDDYYFDDWDEEYYSEADVYTEDGHTYYNEENARQAGYQYAEDRDGWYREESLYYYKGKYYYYEQEEEEEVG